MESNKSLGKTIRALRQQRGEPLRIVAAAIEVDSSLLSKIEHGERLPTEQQLEKIATYFEIPLEGLTARAIAEKIVTSYASNITTLQALKIAEARINSYLENADGDQ
ncbi:MAG: helix-turn-helix transcriptional regulator [Anaerolineae bacterium]|nr:helix-turn-helix transcriptional regulator [Anaerolineae bacterium]